MSGYVSLSDDDFDLASKPISETTGALFIYFLFCYAAIVLIAGIYKICEYFVVLRRRQPPADDAAAASIEVVVQRDATPAPAAAEYAAAVSALPTYTYAELMGDPATAAAAASTCAICLAHYKDGQVARLLPECGHIFHRNCADMWLRGHPTCPICRASTVAEEPPAAAQPPPVVGR